MSGQTYTSHVGQSNGQKKTENKTNQGTRIYVGHLFYKPVF